MTVTFTKTAHRSGCWRSGKRSMKDLREGFDALWRTRRSPRCRAMEWSGADPCEPALLIDTGFTAHHDVTNTGRRIAQICRGIVTMTPNRPQQARS